MLIMGAVGEENGSVPTSTAEKTTFRRNVELMLGVLETADCFGVNWPSSGPSQWNFSACYQKQVDLLLRLIRGRGTMGNMFYPVVGVGMELVVRTWQGALCLGRGGWNLSRVDGADERWRHSELRSHGQSSNSYTHHIIDLHPAEVRVGWREQRDCECDKRVDGGHRIFRRPVVWRKKFRDVCHAIVPTTVAAAAERDSRQRRVRGG